MKNTPALIRIAQEENWAKFELLLGEAMKNPGGYGLDTERAVLDQVAKLRGQSLVTLRRAVRAGHFLKTYHPAALETLPEDIGLAQVELLARLESLDPEVAGRVAPAVLSGSISVRQMRDLVTQTRAETETMAKPSGQRSAGRHRSLHFVATCEKFLEAHVARLTGETGAVLKPGSSLGSGAIPVDFIAYAGDRPVACFEAKIIRPNRGATTLFEIVALHGYRRLIAPQAWLILPADCAEIVPRLKHVRRQLDLDSMPIGILDDTADPKTPAALQIL